MPTVANPILMLLCSHFSLPAEASSHAAFTLFKIPFLFLFVGPESLCVTPRLPFKPDDSPVKQTLFFLISASALPGFGQTSSAVVWGIPFTHAVYSCIPLCGYPGHVTKRRSRTDFPISVTNRLLYIIKLFLLDMEQEMGQISQSLMGTR